MLVEPYRQVITAEMLPYLRTCRNLNQSQFAEMIGIPQPSLSQLETGEKGISDYYEKAIRNGITKLRISNEEINYIKQILEVKERMGF